PQKQRRSEENENVSTEIERIPRKAIWARGDERFLRLEGNHPHAVFVKVERRPHAYQKSNRDKQEPRGLDERKSELRKAQEPIHDRAGVRPGESHKNDADVVKNTLEKIHRCSRVGPNSEGTTPPARRTRTDNCPR